VAGSGTLPARPVGHRHNGNGRAAVCVVAKGTVPPERTVRALAVAVLNAAELRDIEVPDSKPRFVLTIRLPDGTVTADLAAKSVRRIATVREHGPEAVAAIVQGRLSGNQIAEAGLSVQPKGPKPEKAETEAAA
jgi:hypothetical protein